MARRFRGRQAGHRQPQSRQGPGDRRAAGALCGRCVSAGELGLPEPEETGDSFAGNAELKALAAAPTSRPAGAGRRFRPVGRCAGRRARHLFRALGRARRRISPWPCSGSSASSAPMPTARAHFVSVLSLAWPDGHVESFEGRVDGPPRLAAARRRGFGYDPMFLPDGRSQTFGEMDPAGQACDQPPRRRLPPAGRGAASP